MVLDCAKVGMYVLFEDIMKVSDKRKGASHWLPQDNQVRGRMIVTAN